MNNNGPLVDKTYFNSLYFEGAIWPDINLISSNINRLMSYYNSYNQWEYQSDDPYQENFYRLYQVHNNGIPDYTLGTGKEYSIINKNSLLETSSYSIIDSNRFRVI